MNGSQPSPRSRAALPATAIQLTQLLHTPLVNRDGHRVGRVIDVVADRCDGRDLVITGLVAGIDDRQVFVTMKRLTLVEDAVVIDSVAGFDEPYQRRPSELLLVADVLGRRLLDVRIAKLVRARDIDLIPHSDGWMVAGVEVEWGGWWHHLAGHLNRHRAHRTWDALEPLTSTEDGPMVGRFGAGLARLKAADIADLLEHASAAETSDILGDLANNPELEADVFEELDDDHIEKLLEQRDDADIAALLARMNTDPAADAIATLSHDRLVHVLGLLPAHRRVKLSMLLGYNPDTAGGLMGVDFLTVADKADAKHALARVADAAGMEPQALSSVYLLDHLRRLTGAVTLPQLVQAKPGTPVEKLADHDPIRVGPDADAEDVALLMSDHNLVTLPVVDPEGRTIGLITVDDVLETTIPIDWRRREPPPAPRGPSGRPLQGDSPK
jgi:CBS domain-containing protein/sporulation protein YlmC with PRC-barrel domain